MKYGEIAHYQQLDFHGEAIIVETEGAHFKLNGKQGSSGRWRISDHRQLEFIIIRESKRDGNFNLYVAEITSLQSVISDNGGEKKIIHFCHLQAMGETRASWETFTGERSYGAKTKYVRLTGNKRPLRSPEQDNRRLEDDIEAVKNAAGIDETTRARLIDARLGQGAFRQECLKIYPACPVTKITLPVLLRASHIKPWRACTIGQQRLDPYNGIMLAAHIDVLFDRGYLTFSNRGVIKLSSQLDKSVWQQLGITAQKVEAFPQQAHPYLAWHREHVFRT